jgi:hypothetical protein
VISTTTTTTTDDRGSRSQSVSQIAVQRNFVKVTRLVAYDRGGQAREIFWVYAAQVLGREFN